ncbi:MAG: amidase [Amycolatopsis sp.]|uniref:amidase n=1 Tax=Amycolatopsis sp. TaxID=37632 RepID=UPI002605A91C|nr:amidase [Amycolatopsis sp.]MCU1682580.1 amidase [Amycolatopsis sp.]
MTEEIAYRTAASLLTAFTTGELSPVDVVDALAARIGLLDGKLNALVANDFQRARAAAADSAERWGNGSARPLEGLPVVVKDLFDTAGLLTTYGSKMYATHVPVRDAAVVASIRKAGAIVLGKSATHEFAWGITTDSAWRGPTRNPWAPERIPGGSSGGSAAALAAGYAPLALGTDTAGSVRIPAGFCGVAGLKPTFGTLANDGAFSLAPSLDHVGLMARTVADVRLMWATLAGAGRTPRRPQRRPVVGVWRDLDQSPLEPAAAHARDVAVSALRSAGATVVRLGGRPLPEIYRTIATTLLTEALTVHTELNLWPDRRGEYGDDVRARLELAETITATERAHARRARRALCDEFGGALAEVDAIISPISAVGPVQIGVDEAGYREQVITSTAPQSLTGLPALAVPVGLFDGMPVGVQLTAGPNRELPLLDLGALLEAALGPAGHHHPALPRT